MKEDILLYSKVAALASIAFFFIMSGILVIRFFGLPMQVSTVLSHVDNAVSDADTAFGNINDTFTTINRPCGTGKPCGLLANLDKSLILFKYVLGHIDIAATDYDSNLKKYDGQENQLYLDIHQFLTAGTGTLNAATTTLNSTTSTLNATTDTLHTFPPLINAGTNTINEMQGTFKRFNTQLDDPDFALFRKNVTHMSTDFDYRLHRLLHPDPVKLTFWTSVNASTTWVREHLLPKISLF